MASAASPVENPWRVIYKTRNGITNAPNLFKKVPKKSIQAGRGSALKLGKRPGPFGCIGKIKNPAHFSASRVEIVVTSLSVFSLLAGGASLHAADAATITRSSGDSSRPPCHQA